eukprot:TRINITY_DN8246_c0_g1_i1.p1 TRINITY_DN8246_c0_g1~~TRINITY_DN8246_c0_g1_i1.p1  ORF type:complete len:166 (+),score=9.43 TRINITY_DN8246_c0_g1_i1:202-699(+)
MQSQGYCFSSIVKAALDLADNSNKNAMQLVSTNKLKAAMNLLKETEAFLNNIEREEVVEKLGVTLRNMALVHCKEQRWNQALECLNNAVDLYTEHEMSNHLASTYLSICEVHNHFKRYKAAFNMAIKAAFQSQEDLSRAEGEQANRIISLPVSYTHLTLPTICSV